MQAIDIPSPPEQSQPALGEQQLSEGLRFEEYPPRRSKRDHCITYKLTDGRQINTGDGRASRALGYVMEMSPGRWVARVGDLNSGILPLGLAKKATVDLHRRKDKGEPLNWITELNRHMIAEIDRLSVMVSLTDDERYQVKLRWGDFRAEFPRSEYPEDAAHTLWDWGYRGTFSMRWPDGSVATYVKANKRPGTQQATAAPREHHGPTRHGHTRRRSLPRCFLARFRRRAGGTRLSEAAGRPQLNRGPFSFSEMGLAFP